jgi:hypothetical protein
MSTFSGLGAAPCEQRIMLILWHYFLISQWFTRALCNASVLDIKGLYIPEQSLQCPKMHLSFHSFKVS